MEYLYYALAGLLVGGAIAMWQQKRPWWVTTLFAVLALLSLAAGLGVSTR